MRHPGTIPHVLRVAIQDAPNSLDPLLNNNTTEGFVDSLLYSKLVTVDARGTRQIPELAAVVPTTQNGGVSRDGRTITYHLRHGVRWSDGAPFTSRDVAFSWRAIMNPRNNVVSHTGYDLVRAVETPDPYTAVFRMKQPFAPAVDTMFGESDDPYDVVPEHVLGKLSNINTASLNAHPVGTGPFMLKEWVRGDRMTLVPNPYYGIHAKPKLREIVLRFMPDENGSILALRTHDVDWRYEASASQYPQLASIPGLRLVLQRQNRYERIEFQTRRPPFDDVRVRQAVAYAIDTGELVRTLTYGTAAPADQDLPPFMWAHASAVTRYPFDPAKSRALFAAAGFRPGPGGYLVRDGKRLAFVLSTVSTNATRVRGVTLVQAMLRRVGLDVSIKTYLPSLYFAPKGEGGIVWGGKYDVSFDGWTAGIDPDDSSIFSCDAVPPNGNDTTLYCNHQVDVAGRTALDHFERPIRKRAYATIEAIVTRDEPQIYLWWPRQLQPVNPDFQNFDPNPVTEAWNAYAWDI